MIEAPGEVVDNGRINVCICLPRRLDNRPEAEQSETMEKFRRLDPGLQFHFVEYMDPPDVRALRGQPDFERARGMVEAPSPGLLETLADSHVILCVDLPFDMDRLAPNLRWVQSVGAGVAQLQTCGLDRLGVLLTSAAGVAADPIAEFALARILAHWKLFSTYDRLQREHVWKQVFGRDLAGSCLGIVGYGAIGRAIARRARAWGMTVLATRRHLETGAADPAVDRFYPAAELHTMLARCDAVVLCAAETPETYHLFDGESFAAMRQGSYFCNVSRGSLVDEQALIAALESGRLSGASIDVATVEPLPPGDPLWDAPNLAISPHCSATLENFTRNVWTLFYDNLERFLAGRPLRNLRSCSYGE